ncbi:uncharacterized protein [Pseudochaenichthys georgianus]|uniref:uncharacterized protein n=1 Tax=Pseudochaenichthys georgianus TaxID=52239 RepID=UPI0039C32904
MSSNTVRSLETEKRPSAAERREAVRIVVAEILSVCKKPGKKHLGEIARKMVIQYPKSFRDEIEGQVVGTGYDSLTKQMLSRIDNYRRLQSPLQKRQSEGETNDAKKRRKDSYGCINSEPELPAGETKSMQKQKQEEHKRMFDENARDAKTIERLMVETFHSQRRDILSSKGMEDLVKEWPFLFQENGIRIHFRELTGVDITLNFDESTETKFKRILRYFQFQQSDPTNTAGAVLSQTLAGGDETCAAVLMLLTHFREKQEKMLVAVDDTAIASEVDVKNLPSTPCIVVCGNSPLTAKTFMVAVDQVIVNEQLPIFTKALQFMFCSYYVQNIDYPVEIAATLEFLQRCIFKINPDKGTKVKRKEKGRQHAVNPRVLSLITKIANFEWTE